LANPGEKTYVTQSGDWWDLVALRVYGGRVGDEMVMDLLVSANYSHRNTWRFFAGTVLVVPPRPEIPRTPIVPWTTVEDIP
jgi:hypothetical protein